MFSKSIFKLFLIVFMNLLRVNLKISIQNTIKSKSLHIQIIFKICLKIFLNKNKNILYFRFLKTVVENILKRNLNAPFFFFGFSKNMI